jgi:hypothetical protein
MKASEAIERLRELIAQHGDLDLDTVNTESGWSSGNSVLVHREGDRDDEPPYFAVMPGWHYDEVMERAERWTNPPEPVFYYDHRGVKEALDAAAAGNPNPPLYAPVDENGYCRPVPLD